MDLTFAKREAMSKPDRKAIRSRVPGDDVDETRVRNHDERKGGFAPLADVIGEDKEIALEHHAVGQHRPRVTEVERLDTALGKAIDLTLLQIASVQMRQPNHALVRRGVDDGGKINHRASL